MANPRQSSTKTLIIGALGVVYGDIGTSPLYAFREALSEEHGLAVAPENVFGILSLIFWALAFVISIKYLTFVLRADNEGEGGILALLALVVPEQMRSRRRLLLPLGLFGAALLYGDGMLTPAISVLGAVEGMAVAAPVFAEYVVPITVVILAILFLVQHHGTARVGAVFGPVTILWFMTIGVLGVLGIVHQPAVLAALDPRYAVSFLATHGVVGFVVLGSVFLVVTGGEALYADMGHFGRRPIRLAWFFVVLPALLMNYFGQGALLLEHPEAIESPFYRLAPDWAIYPLIGIATAATVIASQAVITGAFSLTHQAVQLGYLPRLEIRHTSSAEIGQIYVPAVNWTLMAATLLVVVGFRSSSNLAAAYGVAVTTTMVITTLLFYVVARKQWNWPTWLVLILTSAFLVVDLSFFGASIVKMADGGWLPMVVAIAGFVLMSTWNHGRYVLRRRTDRSGSSLSAFVDSITAHPVTRVSGTAIFLAADPEVVPSPLLHNLKHNQVLHEHVLIVSVLVEDTPRVSSSRRLTIHRMGAGFSQVSVRYGFMETPRLWDTLQAAHEQLPEISSMRTTFFLGRTKPVAGRHPILVGWRRNLFALMSANARDASEFFGLPPNAVIEIGAQVEL